MDPFAAFDAAAFEKLAPRAAPPSAAETSWQPARRDARNLNTERSDQDRKAAAHVRRRENNLQKAKPWESAAPEEINDRPQPRGHQ